MANAPVKKISDYPFGLSIFEHTNENGRKTYSVSLQRSYKKKDTGEYVNETMNMYEEDLLKLSTATEMAYWAINNIKNNAPKPQAQPVAQQTPASVTNDDIPF
jgi:hypothetical protein